MRVFTSRTLRSTRGRHHTRSNTALFAFAVTRSVAADEMNAHAFLERVRAATASKSWLLMRVSSGGLVEAAAGEDGEGAGGDCCWCCWTQDGGRVLVSSLPMRLEGARWSFSREGRGLRCRRPWRLCLRA